MAGSIVKLKEKIADVVAHLMENLCPPYKPLFLSFAPEEFKKEEKKRKREKKKT